MIVKRHLDLKHLLQQKSHLLFGPRAVGTYTPRSAVDWDS